MRQIDPDMPPTARSGLTTGARLFLGQVDHRSVNARRWRDLLGALGDYVRAHRQCAALSGHDEQLLRRAATACLMAERIETDLAAGRPADADTLVRVANLFLRAMAALGVPDAGVAAKPEPGAALRRYLDALSAEPDPATEAPAP